MRRIKKLHFSRWLIVVLWFLSSSNCHKYINWNICHIIKSSNNCRCSPVAISIFLSHNCFLKTVFIYYTRILCTRHSWLSFYFFGRDYCLNLRPLHSQLLFDYASSGFNYADLSKSGSTLIFCYFFRCILMLPLGTKTPNLALEMRSFNGFWML